MSNKISIALIFLFSFPIFAQQKSSDQYEKALQSYSENDFNAAYIHLKNVLKESNGYVPGKILMGRVLLEKSYYLDAKIEFSEALELGGDIELIIKPLGEVLYNLKRYQEILLLGDKYRLSRTAKTTQHLLKAKAYKQLKQPEQQWQEYRTAYHLSPNEISVLNELSTYHINNQEFTQAQLLINKIIKLGKDDYFTWHLQGQLQKSKGELAKAVDTFEKVLLIKPEYTNAKRALAAIYLQLNNNKKANILVDEVLQASPEDLHAKLLKANLLLAANENSSAKAILNSLTQQLSLVPDETQSAIKWIYFINGVSAFLLENYELAIKELNQYLSNDPTNFHAVILISQAYLKLNQRGYARDLLEKHTKKVVEDKKLAILLCDLYVESRKAFKCEELINERYKNSPDDAATVLVHSRMLYSQNRISEAIKLLERHNKDNRNIQFEDYLISLYMNNNQAGKAAYLANKLLSEFPTNLVLMNSIAAALIEMKMYDHAFKVTQDILGQDANYFPAKYNQASVLIKLKRPKMAKDILLRLVELQPKSVKSRLLLAEVEVAMGQSQKAIYVLNEVLKIDRSNITAQELLVMLLKLTGQYKQALNFLNKLIKQDRLSANYIKTKAELLIASREFELLPKQFNILSNLWNEDAIQLVVLSRLQRTARYMVDARKSMDRAIVLSPQSQKVQFADAKLSIYEQSGRKTEEKLANLKKQFPNNSQVTALQGDSLLAKNEAEKAQVAYLLAFKQDQKNGMALVKASELANKGFKSAEFESALLTSLTKYPNNFYYRNLLADYYLLAKRNTEAQSQYLLIKDVVKLPNKAEVLNNLAVATIKDDLATAEKYAKQASELKPSSGEILDTYGWVLAKQKSYTKALAVLRQARSLNANDPNISYHLGYTLNYLHRKKEAIVALEDAIKSDIPFEEKEEAVRFLSSID